MTLTAIRPVDPTNVREVMPKRFSRWVSFPRNRTRNVSPYSSNPSDSIPANLGPLQKRVLDCQAMYPLAVLHIFGKEPAAAGLECGGNDQGVIEAELITQPYVQGRIVEGKTRVNLEQWREHMFEISAHFVFSERYLCLTNRCVDALLDYLETDTAGSAG